MSGHRASLAQFSPNSQLSRLKRFLAKPSDAVTRCRVLVAGPAPQVLATYSRERIVPALAEDIKGVCDDHAQSLDEYDCEFLVALESEANEVIASHRMRTRFTREEKAGAETLAVVMDGSASSQLAQGQAFTQSFAKLLLTSLEATNAMLVAQNKDLSEKLMRRSDREESLYEQLATIKQENAELQAKLVELASLAKDGGELTEMQKKAFDIIQTFAPAVLAKLGSAQ